MNVEVDVTVEGKAESLVVQLKVWVLVAADPERGGRCCGDGKEGECEDIEKWSPVPLFMCHFFLLVWSNFTANTIELSFYVSNVHIFFECETDQEKFVKLPQASIF